MASSEIEGEYPLNWKLPLELVNIIMNLVLDEDRTAVISRRPAAVGAVRDSLGTIQEENIVISRCGLLRANKALRTIYHAMFAGKVLNLDVDEIIVQVEDFNIKAFSAVFKKIKQRVGAATAERFEYDFHVMLTESFLSDTDKKPLIDFNQSWGPQSAERLPDFMPIKYTVRPIPMIYVENLQRLLNDVFFERAQHADWEFKHLLEAFTELYESRQIVRPEDRDKNLVGNWIRGKFIIKEAHEWTEEELEAAKLWTDDVESIEMEDYEEDGDESRYEDTEEDEVANGWTRGNRLRSR